MSAMRRDGVDARAVTEFRRKNFAAGACGARNLVRGAQGNGWLPNQVRLGSAARMGGDGAQLA